MLEAFGDWEGVMAAPTAELAHAVRTTRWPDTQAPRIQEILRRIKAEHGEITLDFLADWPTEKGLAWLMDMPGIGLKTASLVLLFNFHKPVLPVDTHVHRIAQRVGMIPPESLGRQSAPIIASPAACRCAGVAQLSQAQLLARPKDLPVSEARLPKMPPKRLLQLLPGALRPRYA